MTIWNWASSSDYGTYHIGNRRRLRWACTFEQSPQSLRCSHTWSMEVDEGSDQKSNIYRHWMDAHAQLKNALWRTKSIIISWHGSVNVQPKIICCNYPEIWEVWFYHTLMQTDLGKWCRPWSNCSRSFRNILNICLDLSVQILRLQYTTVFSGLSNPIFCPWYEFFFLFILQFQIVTYFQENFCPVKIMNE